MNIVTSFRKENLKLILSMGFIMGVFSILIGDFTVEAQQTKLPIKEITIEVQQRTISLPGGEAGKNIAKVPIKHARFRSTELRDLNKLYNAVTIERIYEVTAPVGNVLPNDTDNQLKTKKKKNKKLQGKRVLRKKGGKFFESNNLSEDGAGKITADKRVKIRKKQKLESKKGRKNKSLELPGPQDAISEESISAVNDMYIIGFQDYKDANGQTVSIDLDTAVVAYSALPVVISAVKN